MKIQRAFKVRLYPTPEQAVFLNKTLDCCRLLYNLILDFEGRRVKLPKLAEPVRFKHRVTIKSRFLR